MAWRVEFERRAKRELDALGADTRERIVKALQGGSGYRLRVGDYCVIYALEEDVLVVPVVKIGHRRDVYRR